MSQPLFSAATDFETLHADLSEKLQAAIETIETLLEDQHGHDIKCIVEGVIGAFSLAIVLNQQDEDDQETGADQPWMYFWNYSIILTRLTVDDLRVEGRVDTLKQLADSFAKQENPPEELLSSILIEEN